MDNTNALREKLGEDTKDLKLNVQAVLTPERLTAEQTWGVALASAIFLQDKTLHDAIAQDAAASGASDAVVSDARASAALMGMNTIYYRFRHMADDKFSQIPPKLRMNRMRQPASDTLTFELMSMACAVLEGCEMCINAHAASLEKAGATPEQINDAVRIASVLRGFSIATWISEPR